MFDTPIRVFGSLPKSILQFCDYMFQDEELEETISRFKELLDITITEECLRLQCERTPGNCNLYNFQENFFITNCCLGFSENF